MVTMRSGRGDTELGDVCWVLGDGRHCWELLVGCVCDVLAHLMKSSHDLVDELLMYMNKI